MVYLKCKKCQDRTEHEFFGITKDDAILFRCTECMRVYRYDESGIYSMPAKEK